MIINSFDDNISAQVMKILSKNWIKCHLFCSEIYFEDNYKDNSKDKESIVSIVFVEVLNKNSEVENELAWNNSTE